MHNEVTGREIMTSSFNAHDYFHINELKAADSSVVTTLRKDMRSQVSRAPDSTWFKGMFNTTYNKDKLDYRDYDSMLEDPQIKAANDIIEYFLLSKPWHVKPASEDSIDIEIAEFVEDTLKHMDTPMRQIRKNTYTDRIYGYSVSELLFDYDSGNNKIVLRDIIPIHIKTLKDCFKTDEFGNVTGVVQSGYGITENIELGVDKVFITTHDEKFRDKYGNSDLHCIYDNWFMKTKILEWWAIYLEKLEGPTIFATAGENGSTDDLWKIIDQIQEGRAAGVGKNGDKIDVIESTHRGEGFIQALNYHDTAILHAFKVGTLLLGESGGASGSYAQSQTHMDTTQIVLDGMAEDNASDFQRLVKTLVDYNYPGVRAYPEYYYEPFTEKDIMALMTALQPYAQAFLVDTNTKWFEQLLVNLLSEYAGIDVSVDEIGQGSAGEEPNPQANPQLDDQHKEIMQQVQNLFPNQSTGTRIPNQPQNNSQQ